MRISPITNMRFFSNSTEKSASNIDAVKPDSFQKSPSFGAIKIDQVALDSIKNKKIKIVLQSVMNNAIKKYERRAKNLDMLLIPSQEVSDQRGMDGLVERLYLLFNPNYTIDIEAYFKDPELARETIIKTFETKYAEGHNPEGEYSEEILADVEGLKTRDADTMRRLKGVQKCATSTISKLQDLVGYFPKVLDEQLKFFIKSTTYSIEPELESPEGHWKEAGLR